MGPRFACFVPRATLCLLGAALICLQSPAEERGQRFQGKGFDAKLFRATGSNTQRVMRVDPGGLRITLPPDHSSDVPVGLVFRHRIGGDFTITMAFQLVKADVPAAGGNAGVSIWIKAASPTQDAATFGRMTRPSGKHVVFTHQALTPPGKKRQHRNGPAVDTEAVAGRLRLVRDGDVLTYLFAPGESDTFQTIEQTQFTTEVIETIRFAVEKAGGTTSVDAHIKAVTVSADEIGAARPPLARTNWLYWLAGGLAVPLILAGILWLRRKERPAVVRA